MLLLTGAAGFIGSNVLARLNLLGRDDIVCVDNLTDPKKYQNLHGKKFYRYYDYREFNPDAFRKHDIAAVIHLGAKTSTTETNAQEVLKNNYEFSVRLLEELGNSEETTFVYASSASVYGQKFQSMNEESLTETPENEAPDTPYALSKWLFDQYVRGKLRHYADINGGSSFTGLRLFNVYGPGETHKGTMASVAYQILRAYDELRTPVLFENSASTLRDFVYVDDVVDVILWAFDAGPNGIFNVGTGVARSFEDVFNAVHDAAGTNGQYYVTAIPDTVKPTYQYYTRANLKALRAAGYDSEFLSLEKGVAKYWAAFR